eukprot:755167-Hanusia_phi.AAC.12
MATKRLEEHDRRTAVVGDLVVVGALTLHIGCSQCLQVKISNKTFVDVVREDAAAQRYSILQVVLPVPAPNKKLLLPNNAVGSFARSCLQADGLSFEEVEVEASQAPLPLDESICPMRFLIMNCSDFCTKVVRYRSPADFLYDDMLDLHLKRSQTDHESHKSTGRQEDEQLYTGLILSFSLPPNSFATMAVREITRRGTHPAEHESFRDEILRRHAEQTQARGNLQTTQHKQSIGNRRTERRKKLRRKAAIMRLQKKNRGRP